MSLILALFGGVLAPEVAESFANTLRINKFIAGVSGEHAGQSNGPASHSSGNGQAPTADDVVIAMNERLKEVQDQLQQSQQLGQSQKETQPATSAHKRGRTPTRSAAQNPDHDHDHYTSHAARSATPTSGRSNQALPADSLGKAQISSAIKEAKRSRAALRGGATTTNPKASQQRSVQESKESERLRGQTTSDDRGPDEERSGSRYDVLQAQLEACQAEITALREGSTSVGFKGDLEALEERMQAYHDNAIRKMEDRVREDKRVLIQEELSAAVEGATAWGS